MLAPVAPTREGKRKLPLTVLIECPDELCVMHEEIFGSALPMVDVELLDADIA